MARTLAAGEFLGWANPWSAGAISVFFRVNMDGVTSNNARCFAWADAAATSVPFNILRPSVNGRLQIRVVTSGTNMNLGEVGLSADTWYSVGASWTGNVGTASTECKFYLDGTSRAAIDSGGTGSITDLGGIIGLGAIPDDSSHNPGDYQDFALWDRVLTADEFLGLHKGYTPLHYPVGLRFYADLLRNRRDIIGGLSPTTDNGTDTDHIGGPYIGLGNQMLVAPPAPAAAVALPGLVMAPYQPQ